MIVSLRRRRRRGSLFGGAVLYLLSLLAGCSTAPRPGGYIYPAHPVPASAAYKLDEQALLNLRDHRGQADPEAIRRIRDHGWQILRAVTAPAAENSRFPVWMSWCTKEEVFADPTNCDARSAASRTLGGIGFRPPKAALIDPAEFAEGSQTLHELKEHNVFLASSIFMDPNAAARFLQPASQLGSSALLYQVSEWPSKVDKLLNDAGLNGDKRRLAPFPAASIVVKPAWQLVSANFPAQIGVWNGKISPDQPQALNSVLTSRFPDQDDILLPQGNPCRSGGPGPYSTPPDKLKPNQTRLDRFFAMPVCDGALVNSLVALKLPAKIGDYLVLQGFHVVTREIDDWVWTTFWWHDHPRDGKFAAGRPHDIERSVWGNYLMNITLGTPTGRRSIVPNNVFNPYHELGIDGGFFSDCFGCHQMAVARLSATAAQPIQASQLSRILGNAAIGRDQVRTEFLWSIADAVNAIMPASDLAARPKSHNAASSLRSSQPGKTTY